MNSDGTSTDATILDELSRFYRAHELGNKGGEDTRWAKIKMGWINLYIPNTASRKRALYFHDVHHLATGYGTDLRSEAEIGAWEIASGCRDYWAAWILNIFAFAIGLLISPKRTFQAFVRGRHSLNLYAGNWTRDEINQSTVVVIRRQLDLETTTQQPRLSDTIWFLIWTMPLAFVLAAIIGAIIRVC